MARHQALILDFYGFRPFKPHGQAILVEEIARLVRSQLKPRLIFSRSVETLVREKVEVPGYFRLAVLILRTINGHNRTLVAIVERTLSEETRAQLAALLIRETTNQAIAPARTSAYRLTLMKKLSQSTKPSKVKERAGDLALVERLYQSLKPVLDELALSLHGIHYYAHSVIKAEIFQLTRREEKDRYLHLIAFIAHQYFGSVATLKSSGDRLAGCSSWHLRFVVYSSGGNLSRRSYCWRWDGTCAFPCGTATSKSCSPSGICTPTTSRCGDGFSGMRPNCSGAYAAT
jgi:Domain of unknown function (DUF4158)